jgi:hypothetical protein
LQLKWKNNYLSPINLKLINELYKNTSLSSKTKVNFLGQRGKKINYTISMKNINVPTTI